MPRRPFALALALLAALSGHAAAQNTPRDLKVRADREAFAARADWIYNDLDAAVAAAKKDGKPLFVAFRCIPCEACQEFDDDVARRDPIIRDLLERFVAVRIIQANNIDLNRFRYDFDQSFAVVLMHPDGTILARHGTRSDRPEAEDMALEGLRATMEGALKLHAEYGAIRPSLAGKQVAPGPYRTPRDFPGMAETFGTAIDYEGTTAKSCMHCHQVREAERLAFRNKGGPIPEDVLYPYPDPETLGLRLDPKTTATVKAVAPGSAAATAGLAPGETIAALRGQPILSTADVQWALHTIPGEAKELEATVRRADGTSRPVTLPLPDGWRRGNISWRTSTWDLRRMALGGLRLSEPLRAERRALGIAPEKLALQVTHAGEYGEHAVAKRAGVRRGDVIVAVDGEDAAMSESDLIAYALRTRKPGESIALTYLRDGKRTTVAIRQQ
jgi:hypothetical protein